MKLIMHLRYLFTVGDSHVGDIVMLVTLCRWHRDVGDNFRILVTKKDIGDIVLHVGDMPIGHQHNFMPNVMLVTDL